METEEYSYEAFSQIFKDCYGNKKEVCWLKKNAEIGQYYCADEGVQKMILLISKQNLLCYLMDTGKFPHLDEMKSIFIECANKIDVINMNNITM